MRLTNIGFWTAYQDMIQQFESLSYRNDTHRRDLTSISNVLLARLEDLRSTYAGLQVNERETFYTIAKDLLPVTKHFRHRDLGGHLDAILYRCVACNAQFSQQFTEPLTPQGAGNVGTTPVFVPEGGFVHNPVCYQNCASVPHSHAFCLREWSRNLTVQNATDNITGIKGKEEWRCNTCFVDPWSTVTRS
ncbi:hypothetical protein Daus18300_006208 [Diaporthe australafricana]|uniref:Uncharacterized protein n=1 Tax=Diaporthe australafricana TaxID=127596 RepID=A0ABR3WVN6_9PEZI